MMEPKERYKHDQVFHNLVDLFYSYLMDNACRQYTPTELREAVMLAATMYEMQHIRPIMIDPKTYRVVTGDAPIKINEGGRGLRTILPRRNADERLRVKKGWYACGKIGTRVGPDVQQINGMIWTPILWDGDEDPDFQKADSLEPVKE